LLLDHAKKNIGDIQRIQLDKTMLGRIKRIWIESEAWDPKVGPHSETNNNTDVSVEFEDGSVYGAVFFTYENIEDLRKKNKKTGECLNGRYLWARNMIIVESISRKEIEEVIAHLIEESKFLSIFT